MINQDRIKMMEEKLINAFSPEQLVIEDESKYHIGHEGAKTGMGHFKLTIVSKAFCNKSQITCHRMIYDCLGNMMQTEIHALKILAKAPLK